MKETKFSHLGDGHVKVQVEAQYGPGQEDDKHRVRSVLKVGQLDFHASELDPPSNRRVDRRGFEPHRLPICRLDVFEMVHRRLVVLVDPFAEDDQRITDEQMGDVFGQSVVDTCFRHSEK